MEFTPAEWQALGLSVKVAGLGALTTLPLAVALAWLLARKTFPGKFLLDAIVHLPLVLPPVVTGYVLLLVLGTQGSVGHWLYETFGIRLAFTWWGAALVAAIMGLPLAVRTIRLSFEGLDGGLLEAARTLGHSPMRTFFTVTLPLLSPGLLAGLMLSFSRALGEFGATITFAGNIPGQTQTLPLLLFSAIQSPTGDPMANRIVWLCIALSVSSLIAAEWSARRIRFWLTGVRT